MNVLQFYIYQCVFNTLILDKFSGTSKPRMNNGSPNDNLTEESNEEIFTQPEEAPPKKIEVLHDL